MKRATGDLYPSTPTPNPKTVIPDGMLHPSRVKPLNHAPEQSGAYVLYWMQASVRSRYNHALEHAIQEANQRQLPVLVCFGLTPSFPEANLRHYAFLFEGLRDVQKSLAARQIPLVVGLSDEPWQWAFKWSEKAALVVTDMGYLRIQRQWRQKLAVQVQCPLVQVESEAVVPVETASQKEEFAARTLRPKIHKLLPEFLKPLGMHEVRFPFAEGFDSLDLSEDLLYTLPVDQSVKPSQHFQGGETEAQRTLQQFIQKKLKFYAENRNEPALDLTSNLSPYLHYGHISPLDIALQVSQTSHEKAIEEFLEEIIVRRELSFNFCHFNDRYDQFEALPEWALKTMQDHAADERAFVYDLKALEAGETHDPYWNAAQKEMVLTGKMPNYLRMYWGKKVIEWSRTHEEAFDMLLHLNNKYNLDGRDPNSFTGVAWCFGKHDRPWGRRPIFGTLRYMNAGGLERKFDMKRYLQKVRQMT